MEPDLDKDNLATRLKLLIDNLYDAFSLGLNKTLHQAVLDEVPKGDFGLLRVSLDLFESLTGFRFLLDFKPTSNTETLALIMLAKANVDTCIDAYWSKHTHQRGRLHGFTHREAESQDVDYLMGFNEGQIAWVDMTRELSMLAEVKQAEE